MTDFICEMLKYRSGLDTTKCHIMHLDKPINRKGIPILKWTDPDTKLTRYTPYHRLRNHFYYTEPHYVPYMDTWLSVHENQYNAGTEIVDYYYEGFHDVILMAEMQSGKTGTCRYVVHALQNLSGPPGWCESKFTAETMYFICGMNDNDLRAQAITEFKNFLPKENILFSKQLQQMNRNESIPPPSMVIVDESHYASFRNSQVDKFIKMAQKNNPDMLTLSVSATAMAEIAAMQTSQVSKGCVCLKPGNEYYSINQLFEASRIYQAVDITQNQDKFIDLVAHEYEFQKEHADKKYNIVRLPNIWYHKDLEDDLDELDLDIRYINHHSETAGAVDFNTYVEKAPSKFTIIWIYGSLRAGKQLDTRHIGFVHDTAHSGPDIIAQSLLGRILGYNKQFNFVKCYTDVEAAKLMAKWINSAYDTMKIPRGSKGIVGGMSDTERNWALHIPYRVVMDNDMQAYYRTLKQLHGNRYPYKDELFVDLALSATDDREAIIDILEEYQPGHCGGLMILTEENKPKSFNDHWVHNYDAYCKGKFVHCCNTANNKPGKYFYVYVNLNIQSLQYGMALITYKEHRDIGGDCDRASVRVRERSRFSPV